MGRLIEQPRPLTRNGGLTGYKIWGISELTSDNVQLHRNMLISY